MSGISINESEKVRACFIKANRSFSLMIDGKYTLPPPEEERDGQYTHILTPEYCWYMLGKDDRRIIKERLLKHFNNEIEMTPEQVKKSKDVLKYRSPTISQLMWIVDLNKSKGYFPQPFWDFTNAKIEIYPVPGNNEFEYKIGSI